MQLSLDGGALVGELCVCVLRIALRLATGAVGDLLGLSFARFLQRSGRVLCLGLDLIGLAAALRQDLRVPRFGGEELGTEEFESAEAEA